MNENDTIIQLKEKALNIVKKVDYRCFTTGFFNSWSGINFDCHATVCLYSIPKETIDTIIDDTTKINSFPECFIEKSKKFTPKHSYLECLIFCSSNEPLTVEEEIKVC